MGRSLPCIHEDSIYSVLIASERKFQTYQYGYLQISVLYVSSDGKWRRRVQNHRIVVTDKRRDMETDVNASVEFLENLLVEEYLKIKLRLEPIYPKLSFEEILEKMGKHLYKIYRDKSRNKNQSLPYSLRLFHDRIQLFLQQRLFNFS